MSTTTTTPTLNIYQKLALIRKLVEVVQKNRKGYGYTYADEEEILSKITPGMRKYAVSLIPRIVHGSEKIEPYTYKKTKTTKNGEVYEEIVNEILVTAEMVYEWVNNDDPTDRVEVTWILVGQQSDASQAFGSGLTYAERYFLLKYFNVATSDNDPEEYRKKQQEAMEAENKAACETIVAEIHKIASEWGESRPEDKDDIRAIVKQYALDKKGKPTANYNELSDPVVASKLLAEIRDAAEQAKAKQEEAAPAPGETPTQPPKEKKNATPKGGE